MDDGHTLLLLLEQLVTVESAHLALIEGDPVSTALVFMFGLDAVALEVQAADDDEDEEEECDGQGDADDDGALLVGHRGEHPIGVAGVVQGRVIKGQGHFPLGHAAVVLRHAQIFTQIVRRRVRDGQVQPSKYQ